MGRKTTWSINVIYLRCLRCIFVYWCVGELESDDDELNEDDIVYVENLAKRVMQFVIDFEYVVRICHRESRKRCPVTFKDVGSKNLVCFLWKSFKNSY